MRADGAPAEVTVARVIAFGSGSLARSASSNQRSNWRSGSASACTSDSPARMYSWRRSAMFIRRFYRRGRGRKPTSEGNAAVLPLKIVDTRVLLRHLHVTAAPRRGNRDKISTVSNPSTSRSSKARQRRNRDGEKESEEGRQEAQAKCRLHEA